jgi:DNA/RNA endonuclease YhcR with UshA esterase domain
MRKVNVSVVAIAAMLLTCAPLFAHHGFAGRYDEDNPITVTGTVLELQFQNPHSFIIFEAKDATGKTLRWQAELGSANVMAREGWNRTTLKAGDKITITGPQNKNGSGDLNLSHESKITMADSGKVIHNSIKAEQAKPAGAAGAAAAPAAAY